MLSHPGEFPAGDCLLNFTPDTYWDENEVNFPVSWPDKCSLPIGVYDPSMLPINGKYRLLALDEVVASFWKFLGHAATRKALATGKVLSDAEKEQLRAEVEKLQERIAHLEKELAKARLLQRNVPFTLIFVKDENHFKDEALSLREETKLFAEFVGLSGWNKIIVIGLKRDELIKKGNAVPEKKTSLWRYGCSGAFKGPLGS